MPNTRAAEVQQERRRRTGGSNITGLKLHVPESMKDPAKVYRWANDQDSRLAALTKDDDWDIVRNTAIEGQGEGTPVVRNVEKNGPQKAVLISKPKRLHEQDQAEKQRPIAETEDTIRRGGTGHITDVSREDLAGTYTPGGKNTIDGR